MSREPPAPGATALFDLARLFLKLGTISFGGPAAHTAMMREEIVRRRGWLTDQEFLDLVGATNLIPGPNSTELAIHVGRSRAGWKGLLVAGACFILPATLLVAALAWAYVRFGALPRAQGLLHGIKPVVIAVVAHALWKLGRTAVKSLELGAIGLGCMAALLLGANEVAVLAAGAAAAGLARGLASRGVRRGTAAALATAALRGVDARAAVLTGGAAAAGAAAGVGLGTLFAVFLKAGALLFGSGYVLLAFLRADLVGRLGWLTEQQLLDAVAVGQMTPGPLFTTATFVGYVLGGARGAFIATVGIFLPAFVYVAIGAPILPRLRRSALAGTLLDGVNVASLALMGVVAWQLGRAALVDPLSIGIALASAALLLGTRLNPAWLVAGGALVGLGSGP